MRLKLWDEILQDEDGEQRSGSHDIRCTRCDARGLHWEDDNGKWILVHKNGEIHRCPSKEPMDIQTLIENGF